MEKLVFSHSVEAFVRAVRPVLDGTFAEQLKTVGIDTTKPLLPAYPVDVLREALLLGAKRLNPTLSQPQAFVALGRRYVDGYGETLVRDALADVREHVVIGTTFGYDVDAPRGSKHGGQSERPHDWSKDNVMRSLERSLGRLGRRRLVCLASGGGAGAGSQILQRRHRRVLGRGLDGV